MLSGETANTNSLVFGLIRMDNPETLVTLGTQDTGRKQINQTNTTQKTKKESYTDSTKNRG
jgi:hypothetical protein